MESLHGHASWDTVICHPDGEDGRHGATGGVWWQHDSSTNLQGLCCHVLHTQCTTLESFVIQPFLLSIRPPSLLAFHPSFIPPCLPSVLHPSLSLLHPSSSPSCLPSTILFPLPSPNLFSKLLEKCCYWSGCCKYCKPFNSLFCTLQHPVSPSPPFLPSSPSPILSSPLLLPPSSSSPRPMQTS